MADIGFSFSPICLCDWILPALLTRENRHCIVNRTIKKLPFVGQPLAILPFPPCQTLAGSNPHGSEYMVRPYSFFIATHVVVVPQTWIHVPHARMLTCAGPSSLSARHTRAVQGGSPSPAMWGRCSGVLSPSSPHHAALPMRVHMTPTCH